MSDSDSGLSSAPEEEIKKLAPIFAKAKKATKLVAPPPKLSPPRPKRAPSPPHEDTIADSHVIAFIVMFRSRFSSAFSTKLAHIGPQDLETGVAGEAPTREVESLLCAVLGLVMNRKKPVEHGHYGRALDEAVLSHKSQWPHRWQGANPLHGGKNFNNMPPEDRLYLIRTLIMWSLNSSELISAIIKDSYKQTRHSDDENQPLSVQPWGRDGDKRRYFLIEGQDDTTFRVYREANRYTKNFQWYNMAGNIDELRVLAEKLEKEDGSQVARTLGQRMLNAIPRFEASVEKRYRREYRQARRAAFTRPEPGFSSYEGRTRGKRMRYTYDDEEDSDATSTRRSNRHSERNTPAATGPQYTSSGRQVRPRQANGEYGTSGLANEVTSADELGQDGDSEDLGRGVARTTRGAMNGYAKRKRVLDDDDDDADLSEEDDLPQSGDEWNSDANAAEDEERVPAAANRPDDEDEDEDESEEGEQSLIVKLRIGPPQATKVDDEVVPKHLPEANGIATKPVVPDHASLDLRPYPSPLSMVEPATKHMLQPQQRSSAAIGLTG
ncbi:hypothetical protein B0A48_09509 [Cryoendolithus antarcticus]|uniref:WHIM1 domain-containing protein n=1 Tax=Cryoendolithus antarcticus TaxID=1507870 RepID=A0A1V8SZK0_9PEZI|nr:hypothetical protein B0A48_09509 [Cryoendolithus antarcticus]